MLSGTMPTTDSPGLEYFYPQAKWTKVQLKFSTYMTTLCSIGPLWQLQMLSALSCIESSRVSHQAEELPVGAHQVQRNVTDLVGGVRFSHFPIAHSGFAIV
jgi:hypothetical protein